MNPSRPAAAGHDETPSLTIIGPAFFGYTAAVADNFAERGIDVMRLDEKHANDAVSKALYRSGIYRLPLTAGARHRIRLLDAIMAQQSTDVLLLNVESVDREFVQQLRDRDIRVHVYMWDGIKNKPGFVRYLDLMDGKASFDPVDCQALGLTYIPLFAEGLFSEPSSERGDERTIDISFCGTVHSNRVAIMAWLLAWSRSTHRRVEALLFYHWRWLLYFRGISNWAVWRLLPDISFSSFGKAQIAEMFRRSRLVLDIPHHGQSGMTARTFEVLASGARLLTFNRTARKLLPPELAERIVEIDRIEDIAKIDFGSMRSLPLLTSDQSYYLSLNRFVDQLAHIMQFSAAPRASSTLSGEM